MKLRATDRRPCRLGRGEARRVSQDRRQLLVGYHLGCPRCGFVSIAFAGHEGLIIREGEAPSDVSFSLPLRCVFCRVLIHVDHGEITLVEDPHVRRLPHG